MALDRDSPDGKLRVLSLDGGGFRGLGALYAIEAIMKAANERNRETKDTQLQPCDVFDWVIGASAGGLVATLIGRLGLSCTDAINDYKTIATALFGTDRDAFTRKVLSGVHLDSAALAAYESAIIAVLNTRDPSRSHQSLKNVPKDYVFDPAQPPTTQPRKTTRIAISTAMNGSKAQSPPSTGASGVLWSIRDLVQAATAATAATEATTAADRYMPLYEPKDSSFEEDFRDVAYLGGGSGDPAINPTITALLKPKKDFVPADVGVLVSVGQGFRQDIPLLSTPKPLKSDVTSAMQSAFLSGVTDANGEVVDALLPYVKQAQHAHKAWDTVSNRFGSSAIKLDPPAVPNDRFLDLADIFHADKIKSDVEQWAKANDAVIKQIAAKLVKEKPDPERPDPQPGVRPYNPRLDAAKPKEMLDYLSTYHVIFIVDDSSSMILEDDQSDWNDSINNRWNQAQQAIGPIAQFAYDNKVTNIDMGFMHYRRTNPVVGLQSRATVEATFRSAKPPRDWYNLQLTPTAATLDFYLNTAMNELDQTSDPVAYKNIRPTDIILLTDGEADDDPKASMRRARDRMDAGKHNHNYIGITIVQIGNSKKTAVKLADITNDKICGDMANLIPSNGQDLDDKKLARILLGGIHPTVRRKIGNLKS